MSRAVFFDVGGTLIRPWPSVGAVYARIGRQFGFNVGEEAMEQAFRAAWKESKRGALTSSEKLWWRALVNHALESLELKSNEAYFETLYEAFAQADAWQVLPGVQPCLEGLRSQGWHVGVISNWDSRLRPLLDRVGLSRQFDSITVSSEVGAEKPDARIFEAALAKAGVSASDAWHVGDSIEEDVRGAEAVGMRAILFAAGDLQQVVLQGMR